MSKTTIKKNESIIKIQNFIYSCEAVILNCELDIIEKNTTNSKNFNIEKWQKRSFLHNKQFKTGSKYWREKEYEIRNLQQSCKSILPHYFFELDVPDKHKIYNTLLFKITESINNIQKFIDKYNLTHCEILPNVFFIFDMRQLNIELKEWIEKTLQNYSGRKQQTPKNKTIQFKDYVKRNKK